ASERESIAVLWALGRAGGAQALATLTRWAEHAPAKCRLEAIESLAELRAPEALPVFVRGLAISPSRDLLASDISAACAEHLTATGDSTVLGPLQALSRQAWAKSGQRQPWSPDPLPTERLLVVRAACGDFGARDSIVENLALTAGATRPEAIEDY